MTGKPRRKRKPGTLTPSEKRQRAKVRKNRAARAKRNRRIAEYRVNHTRMEASDHFNLSHTVIAQCEKLHPELPRKFHKPYTRPKSFVMLRELLAGKTTTEIGREYHCNKQLVEHIRRRAEEAGIDLPPSRTRPKLNYTVQFRGQVIFAGTNLDSAIQQAILTNSTIQVFNIHGQPIGELNQEAEWTEITKIHPHYRPPQSHAKPSSYIPALTLEYRLERDLDAEEDA